MTNDNIHHRPYQVNEYNDNWPKLYRKYALLIQSVLGDNLIEIHHLGSTSIPGMFAKPNIDIYAAVSSLAELRVAVDKLQKVGFTPRGDYSHIGEEYYTVDQPDGQRIASIHIFQGHNPVIGQYINFRDYLVTHRADRESYIALKRELYDRYRDDYPAYDKGKQALIDAIKAKARLWASGRTSEG